MHASESSPSAPSGIFVPPVTPFSADGSIDLASFRRLVRRHVAADVRGVVVNGTTGESPTVTCNEVELLARVAREECGETAELVIGTGSNDTATTIAHTRRARELSAASVLVVVPYYSRPSQAGIVDHFRRVADVGVPVICYNIPYRTGVALTRDTLHAILELPGVIGLKESSGDLANTIDLAASARSGILCGEDILVFPSLSIGASGAILAAANLNTREFVDMYEELRAGNTEAARLRYLRLVPMIKLLFEESNPAPLKYVLARQGTITTDLLRPPMTGITNSLKRRLDAYFESTFRES